MTAHNLMLTLLVLASVVVFALLVMIVIAEILAAWRVARELRSHAAETLNQLREAVQEDATDGQQPSTKPEENP